MYIYLDESGDLGFDLGKTGTSAYFVITLLLCHDVDSKKAFQIAVRRTVKNKLNRKRKNRKKNHELKGGNTSLPVKQYFLKRVKNDNWSIYTVVLNKTRVYESFQTSRGQSKLYNFLAKFIIEKLPLKTALNNVRLVVDKSKNRAEIQDFNNYISTYIEGSLPLNTGFNVEHLSPTFSLGE